jgi:hypothetical protein
MEFILSKKQAIWSYEYKNDYLYIIIREAPEGRAPDAALPDALPNPPEMQKYLGSLGVKNYKQAAPPLIAKAKP